MQHLLNDDDDGTRCQLNVYVCVFVCCVRANAVIDGAFACEPKWFLDDLFGLMCAHKLDAVIDNALLYMFYLDWIIELGFDMFNSFHIN